MRLDKLLPGLVARFIIHPVLTAYLEYIETGEDPADSGRPGYDPRSTIAADTSVAANRDHDTMEVIVRQFGFTSKRRAYDDASDTDTPR